ncbi:MAG: fumarate hydratase [Lentisphaerae bacterium]|nr:fumarate hydratase [Lentisphaerota bacterium]
MKTANWERNLLDLIRRTSTDLPSDIEAGLRKALRSEKKNSHGYWVIRTALDNAARARGEDLPICQDTGTPIFHFRVPVGFDTNALVAVTRGAVSRATRRGYLRENVFDAVSGKPFYTNVAPGSPVIRIEQGARKTVDARLILKGGGSENVGTQYSLPDERIGAGRDLEGVRRCALDAVWKAQGAGCAPGVLGICIGGDRATGYECSKEQFLRKLSDVASDRELARLESRIVRDSCQLGIGPMGLGGRTALLGAKIAAMSRAPASFFVTVSYLCWAFRRRGMVLGPEGGLTRWLY